MIDEIFNDICFKIIKILKLVMSSWWLFIIFLKNIYYGLIKPLKHLANEDKVILIFKGII